MECIAKFRDGSDPNFVPIKVGLLKLCKGFVGLFETGSGGSGTGLKCFLSDL